MRKSIARILSVQLFAILSVPLLCQDSGSPDTTNPFERGVEWGGEIRTMFTSRWDWTAYPDPNAAVMPSANSLAMDTTARLFFDARANDTFRAYGELEIAYPFDIRELVDGRESSRPNMRIRELYSEYNWFEYLYFRAGKQTIDWGAGYFFSPADRLNLTQIDWEYPEKPVEGPLAVGIHLPIDVSGAGLYIVAEDAQKLDGIALAPRIDLVFDRVELGLGGVFKNGDPPCAILVSTADLGNWFLFAESIFSYGSARTFVRHTGVPPFIETFKRRDEPFVSLTAGFRFVLPEANLRVAAQYFFNGEGYADSGALEDAVAAFRTGTPLDPALTARDLKYFGMHETAVSVSWDDLVPGLLGCSLLWRANFSDLSGYFLPAFVLTLFEHTFVRVGARIFYGDDDDEMLVSGSRLQAIVECGLGTGTF